MTTNCSTDHTYSDYVAHMDALLADVDSAVEHACGDLRRDLNRWDSDDIAYRLREIDRAYVKVQTGIAVLRNLVERYRN